MDLAPDLLDNPAWAALTGPHARFADRHGQAARYRPGVSPFAALSDPADERAWADLAALIGPGGRVVLTAPELPLPEGWEAVGGTAGVQMLDVGVAAADDPEMVELTGDDVPQMLELVARTQPGPFEPGTIELGGYIGVKRDGVLVAMAGQRMGLPGWTEISAVCTDEAYRGQGLAGRMVLAVAAGIRRRGDTPLLHAAETNTGAIRLYESLGFRLRRRTMFILVQAPGA